MVRNEDEFYQDLKNIFIGAKVEGNSGFVNLMKIKSTYFEKILKFLKSDIEKETAEFPEFKEELFTKLHTFFRTYFSESGSIYFSYTPLKSKVYEKIYTNNQDVMLFWKTNMLYYVKTDNLYKTLSISCEIEGSEYTIKFDATQIEGKRSNEKRVLIFELESINDRTITFKPQYSEHGKETKVSEILKEFYRNNINITEDQLDGLFKTFKRQTEVDYFINKDAKAFLREQFDLWLKNYIFDDESDYSEKRLKQLKTLKYIAYKVIDFVAQFEDELVKIWNKPKFILNSNYVVTLDRIVQQEGGYQLLREIISHANFSEQVKEWVDLGIVKDDFKENSIIVAEGSSISVNSKYETLPIDTKYFKDMELKIIQLFSNLDAELDGYLIHGENYQVLRTIFPKWREKVELIYLDPPFNTGNDFIFLDNYQVSSWLTMIKNRLDILYPFLNPQGNLYLHLDHISEHYARILLDNTFGADNFRAKITWNTGENISGFKSQALNWIRQADFIHYYVKGPSPVFHKAYELLNREDANIGWLDVIGDNKKSLYVEKWNNGSFVRDSVKYRVKAKGTVWNDIYSFQYSEPRITESLSFASNQKPENLLRRIVQTSSNPQNLVLDCFLGSGTTTSVAQKLSRKWIGIEMGDYFNETYLDVVKISKTKAEEDSENNEELIERNNLSIIKVISETKNEMTVIMRKIGALGRMKIVLHGDKEFRAIHSPVVRRPHLSKDVNWNGGGFFKYYEVEQYEQALKNTHYSDSEPFFKLNTDDVYNQYVFLKDKKMIDRMEVDYKNNKIKIKYDEIYPNIDLAETLSNIKGKFIKRIEKDAVIFEDDEKVYFSEIDFQTIKPLIWW
ncbi:DNA methyltransferase [Cuniculiplasma divulgatum]|uniref:Type III restriction-modification system subunit M n=1 Tax=Cuniculiplasma divulgatum TaxID=1673428 RepID=A0A1N5WEL5_9ARCH|nr:site-specific DNA-methyltransferase [Cuniculiplasma divulgatum]SIM83711.1 type III restriction-modification system subunit M [Cuniculiplasma divulgatum]